MKTRAVLVPSIVAAAVLGSTAGPAFAADVPAKPIYKAAPVVEAFNPSPISARSSRMSAPA